MFDPLDIYYMTKHGVSPNQNEEVERHYRLAKKSGLDGLTFDVSAWVPGEANRRRIDPDWFQTLQLSVPAMGLDEWALLLRVDVLSEPMGQAFAEARRLVATTGYNPTEDAARVDGKADYSLDDLIRAIDSEEIESLYAVETRRAVKQRLSALQGTGLFASGLHATTVRTLLAQGRATIILLARLDAAYREAIVAILTRMLLAERQDVSFAEKRLVLDPSLSDENRKELQAIVDDGVPRTVVVLDEAQSFLAPGQKNPACELFIRLVKEGRNMGLSAVIATQQPSAIDKKVLSQVMTFVSHQLVTEGDIQAVKQNLKSSLPTKISFGQQELDLSDLLRQLPPGSCLVSASDMDTTIRRAVVVNVRARATVHGGIELMTT
jgi:hypothetical protein